jgi:hypothetical protein
VIRCSVLAGWRDNADRELVKINTADPFQIESTEGLTELIVQRNQILTSPRRVNQTITPCFVHKLRQLPLPTTRPQESSSGRLHQPAGYHGSTMVKADLCLDNDAARAELTEIATRLDAASAAYSVGSTWTVATSLCHLAFWDRRVLSQLKRWQESGSIEAVRLDPQSVASINEAVNLIALRIPAPAAIALAVESAAAVDAFIVTIDEELAERIIAAGFERYLRRSLHRREHLRRICRAVDEPSERAE